MGPMIRYLPLLCVLLLPVGCATPDGMVRVGGGAFFMGTDRVDEEMEAINMGLPDPWYADEHPYHRVVLEPFFIDRTEVTNRQYQAFLEANPAESAPDDWSRRHYPQGQGDFPVVYVNWFQASHYCRWQGGRLPTESEWEKAARGKQSFIYPWGNRFESEYANVSSGPYDRGRARPVGSLPQGKSPYGALDMVGNVWEWVDSDYAPYPGSTEEVSGYGEGNKVMRGLSFEAVGHHTPLLYQKVVAISARASFRSYDHSSARLRDVGFRCARNK